MITKSLTTDTETGAQETLPKPKPKLCFMGDSNDGNKIFCMYKYCGKTLARGFYDFLRETFVILSFNPNNLNELTPEEALRGLAKTLLEDFDWEFNDLEKTIKMVNEGNKINAKRNRVKKRKYKKTSKPKKQLIS